MTSITLARPANIPYEALYVHGERMLSSGYGRQLDIDDVLITLAMLSEDGPIHLKVVSVEELSFDAESNHLPLEERNLRIERVEYEVDGVKVGVS